MSASLLQSLFSSSPYSLAAHLRYLHIHSQLLTLQQLKLFADLLLPLTSPPPSPLLSNIFYNFQLKNWYIIDSVPTKTQQERLKSRRIAAETMLQLLQRNSQLDMRMSKQKFNVRPDMNEQIYQVLERLGSCKKLNQAEVLVRKFKKVLSQQFRKEISKTLSVKEEKSNNQEQAESCKTRAYEVQGQSQPVSQLPSKKGRSWNLYVIFLVIVGLIVLMGGTTFLYLFKRHPWLKQMPATN